MFICISTRKSVVARSTEPSALALAMTQETKRPYVRSFFFLPRARGKGIEVGTLGRRDLLMYRDTLLFDPHLFSVKQPADGMSRKIKERPKPPI